MSKKSKKTAAGNSLDIPLEELPGVGDKTRQELVKAGYKSVRAIAEADPSKLAEKVDGVGDVTAQKMIDAAMELVKDASLQELPGVGDKTRQGLVKAGYKLLSKIAETDPSELAEKVDGVGEATAKKIVKAAKKMSKAPAVEKTPEKEAEEKPAPKKPAKKAKPAKKTPKPKPSEQRVDSRLVRLAREKRRRKPAFRNVQSHRWKRVKDSWRKVRGIDSAVREKKKGRPAMVNAGYRTPKAVRGLHPSNLEEVLVYRPADLDGLDPDIHAVRIGGTVGMRKKQAIIKKADTMMLRVLNPGAPEDLMEEDLFTELDVMDELEVD